MPICVPVDIFEAQIEVLDVYSGLLIAAGGRCADVTTPMFETSNGCAVELELRD